MKISDNIKLVNDLYYIGSIATIMKYPESVDTEEYFNYRYTIGKIYNLKVNDNISINAAFGQIGPDMFSISDYEDDHLLVEVIKNGELAGRLIFDSYFKNSRYIGIGGNDFSSAEKIERIEQMKPNAFERAGKVLSRFHSLDQIDVEDIKKKSEEMKNWASEMVNENTQYKNTTK